MSLPRSVTFILAVIAFTFCADALAAQWQVFGQAKALDADKLLYSETYQFTTEQQKPVRASVVYASADGRKFAEKRIEYGAQASMPNIRFTDLDAKMQIDTERVDQRIKVTITEQKRCSVEWFDIEGESPLVVDAGFDGFVKANWAALLKGTKKDFRFLVIDRVEIVRFSLSLVKSTADGYVFELKPTDFWASILVDPIELVYDQQQRLLSYRGLTNIAKRDAGKVISGNYIADIDYQYQQSQ